MYKLISDAVNFLSRVEKEVKLPRKNREVGTRLKA